MEKIKNKLYKVDAATFFSDSDEGIRSITKAINHLIDKTNEVIKENNDFKERIIILEEQLNQTGGKS